MYLFLHLKNAFEIFDFFALKYFNAFLNINNFKNNCYYNYKYYPELIYFYVLKMFLKKFFFSFLQITFFILMDYFDMII